jgi:hypothetical protein
MQGKNLLIGSGLRLGVTASSQLDVNALAAVSGATVTNVTKADTYTISVAGDGAISGDAGDIANACHRSRHQQRRGQRLRLDLEEHPLRRQHQAERRHG